MFGVLGRGGGWWLRLCHAEEGGGTRWSFGGFNFRGLRGLRSSQPGGMKWMDAFEAATRGSWLYKHRKEALRLSSIEFFFCGYGGLMGYPRVLAGMRVGMGASS